MATGSISNDKLSEDVRPVGSVDRERGRQLKAAELLYQRHVGSAFAFIRQCRVYLHFKQGARPHDWHRTGSQKQRCFLPVTQQPRMFSVQVGVGSEGAAHQLENQKGR